MTLRILYNFVEVRSNGRALYRRSNDVDFGEKYVSLSPAQYRDLGNPVRLVMTVGGEA